MMKRKHFLIAALSVMAGLLGTSCSDNIDDNTLPATMEAIASGGNRFTGEGGTLEILIYSDVEYDVKCDADWISRIISRSTPVNNLERFDIRPYPIAADMTPRTADITISYPGTEQIVYTIEQTPIDIFRFNIENVSATYIPSAGGTLTITINTNLDYSVNTSDQSWISLMPNGPYHMLAFTIAENKDTEARSGKIIFSTAELGETTVEFTQAPFIIDKGISTPDQLMDFAAAVNSGSTLEPWLNDDQEVVLLADIDMTGRQWTPAGNLRGSTITNGATTLGNDGHAFCGIFNGNGHTIRNLTMSTDSEQCYGLFGVLSSATVKNLVIDTSCTMQIVNEGMGTGSAYGFIAGLAFQSTIYNVTVEGTVLESVINKGARKAMGTIAGIAGYAYSSTISDCRFSGIIRQVKSDMYDNSLGSGVAGIIGFSRATSSQPLVIENCVNSGYIYAEANRVAGILGSTSGNFTLRNCENSGIVHAGAAEAAKAGWSAGLRVGGILGFSSNTKASNKCLIESCTNSGTVVCDADAKTQTGGILGLVRNLTLNDVSNTGCVIANSGSIAGLICGQLQCADKPTVISANVSGRFAHSYTGSENGINPQNPVEITADNYFIYAAGNITGSNSGIWDTSNVKFR